MRQGEAGLDDPAPEARDAAPSTAGDAAPSTARPGTPHARVRDLAGVLWTIAAAVVVLIPALRPGVSLGPFDLLSRFGLTSQAGVVVHNAVQADQIQQFVPWTNLAWLQVHGGHLPLWDPYNVLGMPLAFNWQSGVFSLPALVSYLFPVSFAYTAVVLVKLIIAGTGAYALCRMLRLSPLAAAFGGTAFELSGPMIVHAGWPHTAVTCWAGWILVAVVGLLRGRHRLRNVALLAVAVGFAVYGGHPESLIVMGVAVVVFVVVYLVARPRATDPLVRPLVDLAVGALCGFGLGAPLLFPGVQLAVGSVRDQGTGMPAFPLSHATNLLLVGLQGEDFKTAAYVGVVVLALAVVAVRVAWKRPEVPALAAVTVVSALLTFFSPADGLMHLLPGGRTVSWSRAVMLLALGLAILAAIGIDALARSRRDRTAVRWAAGAFAVAGVVVAGLAVGAQAGLASAVARHRASLVWPAVQSVVGVVVCVAWLWSGRSGAHSSGRAGVVGRGVAALLLALETAFLLSAGIPFWSVSPSYFPTNPDITALQDSVGSSLVGFGSCRSLAYNTASKTEVGIRPNANIGYDLREMVAYDPILPENYFKAWTAAGGQHTPHSLSQLGIFCAQFTTAAQAREFGVRWVLEPPGRYPPKGATIVVRSIGDERLVFIPESFDATTTPDPLGAAPLPADAPGYPVAYTEPDAATWRLDVDTTAPSVLRLRLTDVPGWHATIDGHPLALESWASGLMIQARVPAGKHIVELTYWPTAFSAGIAVGGAVAVGLVAASVTSVVIGRRRRRSSPEP